MQFFSNCKKKVKKIRFCIYVAKIKKKIFTYFYLNYDKSEKTQIFRKKLKKTKIKNNSERKRER